MKSSKIEISQNKTELNAFTFVWDRWPTNAVNLWIPEIWTITKDTDRLMVEEPAGWKKEGSGFTTDNIKSVHGDYAFQWQVRLGIREAGIEIELTVENVGTIEIPGFFSFNSCLNFATAPDFMDSTGGYTCFRSGGGWLNLADMRRPQAKRIGHDAYHILFKGFDDQEDEEALQDIRSESSLCLRIGRTGSSCIGFAWDHPLRVDVNFNRLQCIHSSPALGPILPGKSVDRKGKIYFHDGSRDSLLALCRQEGLT